MDFEWLTGLLFFVIALIYASVGFGGGSSYIAILILLGESQGEIKGTALLCNIIVVTSSTIQNIRKKLVDWGAMFPLVILSAPLAFVGGLWRVEMDIFKLVVGISLIVAAAMMFYTQLYFKNYDKNLKTSTLLGIGGGIGLLSGFIGIGGGIFLSPILHLTKWRSVKTIGAATSLFILINSIFGLLGLLMSKSNIDVSRVSFLAFFVLAGGLIGSNLHLSVLQPKTVRLLTAILIAYVGIKTLFTLTR